MKDEKKRFVLVSYATQTETMIQDTESKDASGNPVSYGTQEALVKIMNDIEEIKKSL